MSLVLDPRTVTLISEAFAGHVCCRCGFAAQRLTKGFFYCADCYPRQLRERPKPYEVRRVKEPCPFRRR